MKSVRRIPLFILLLWTAVITTKTSGQSQLQVRLEGYADSLHIGDEMNLRLQISAPGPGRLFLPNLGEALAKFDLLAPPDTSGWQRQSDTQPRTLGLKLTCYEAGEQVLQPISVIWLSPDSTRLDSAATDPIIIHVAGVVPDSIFAQADTAQKPFRLLEPNRIKKLPLAFADFLPWILGALAAVGFFFSLRWLWRKIKRHKQEVEEPAAPARPPQEVALEELDQLRDQRLFQSGHLKEYYSSLSEIIRRYIEGRFEIAALESTSFQLLREMEAKITDGNLRSVLQNLLEDADLAKFAKQQPDQDTCQRDLEKGYVFVRKTTAEEKPASEAA